MPRSGYTQTRTFNYNPNSSTVGVDLLSATNPENGTVTYTYNSDHTLATKTDANGNHFTFSYDYLKRLTQVSVGGNTLRTYSYDSNPFDAGYSQYTAGRLTAIQYNQAINYNLNPGTGSTSFIDMFSYSQPGQLNGKRLRVTKTQQYLSQTQTATADLNLTYGYNAEGKMTNVGYPTGPSYTYSFDAMMRPSGMTDQSNIAVVNNVQYGPANELLSMNMPSAGTETRTYNSMLQLTSISGMGQNVTYTFPSATNNGKISSQTDNLSGETVTYQYDSLNRLIQASGSGWSQSQTYDGFGNLTNRTGSMPMSTPVDPATNRLSMAGVNYDANGNMTSNGYYGYDAENRLTQINSGQTQYAYDGQNKRIWQGSFALNNGDWYLTSDTISLFGIDGKLIGTYQPQQSQTTLTFNVVTQRVYFGSKLIGTVDSGGNLSVIVQDRLGSRGKYYPYGEERNSPQLQNDQVKFATYTRDSATGLDYADQRYYASTFGRFMTPDPYRASGGASNPQSWNRYTYADHDPIGRIDPTGLVSDGSDRAEQDGSCDWSLLELIQIENGSVPGPCRTHAHWWLLAAWELAQDAKEAAQERRQASSQVPQCDIQVGVQNIPNVPFGYHTYIEIIMFGFPTFLEATNSPKSNPTSVNTTPACLVGGCWLNKQFNFGGPTYDFATVLRVDIALPDECTRAAIILAAFGRYQNNTHTYAVSGPNSNSFTHTLLKLGGVDETISSLISALSAALGFPLVGWDVSAPWP